MPSDVTYLFGDAALEGGGGPSPEDLAAFPMNDLGHGMRLICLAGGVVGRDGLVDSSRSKLLHLLGYGWIGFNGAHWDRKFGEELARKLAHQVSYMLPSLYPFLCTGESPRLTPKDFYKACNDAGSAGKTSAMLRQAQSYLMVEIDAFDRDPLALNCLNGTVKMAWRAPKGGGSGRFEVKLQRHDPADRITRCCSVDYDPEAAAPLFEKVVSDSLPREPERRYAHQVLGYGATGYTHEQVFLLLQGRGRDGKSTVLDAVRETLGSYALAASPETFLEGGMRGGSDASPDLIALSGDTRFAVLSEPKRGSKMNEGLLKAWTSGSPISARDLHAKPINFRPTAKLFFEMNAFMVARGDDDGIWRRIRPILFRHQVPLDQVDRLLPQKLEPERPGILNWLIAGVGDWLAAGKLEPPESLKQVLEDYRKASSPFGDWLAECCVTQEAAGGHRELVGELLASFKEWSEEQGHDKVMSARAFGDALSDRQVGLMGKNSKGLKYRGPIRLKTASERALEASEVSSVFTPPETGAGGVGDLEPGSDLDIDLGDWDGLEPA